MQRVTIQPALYRWAMNRSGRSEADLLRSFPQLASWLSGAAYPTFKQLEKLAAATHTPLGFFFLPAPPQERLPIQDFRTVSAATSRPSADLLDTIYAMQRRQAWLSEERRDSGCEPLAFVGSAKLTDSPASVGREMRRVLGLANGWASKVPTWAEAISMMRQHIEAAGVMAVINGVVGNNTSRKLRVNEFRGFALVDAFAPLIFVNGADVKSAQMFTLVHELAHVWLGSSAAGVTGYDGPKPNTTTKIEQFCDAAAAEFLIPESEIKGHWKTVRNADEPFVALARLFKVSPIVAGRRAMDVQLVDREEFFAFYADYTSREQQRVSDGGGDFYANQRARVGEDFARTVMNAALDGRLSFHEAYHLTGLNGGTFQDYGRKLGVALP